MKKTTQNNDLRDAFPVIRIGYNKRLLGSNTTALPLLSQWGCRQHLKVPDAFLDSAPEIADALGNPSPGSCKMQFGDLQIWFDIVPFPEAGYIGLYGYHIESMVPENRPEKLRIAA